MDEETALTRLQLLNQLLGLALSLWLVWQLIPPHRRQSMAMSAAHRARTAAEAAALQCGRWGMSLEWKAQRTTPAAQQAYDLAEQLLTGPARVAGRWYDQARGVVR